MLRPYMIRPPAPRVRRRAMIPCGSPAPPPRHDPGPPPRGFVRTQHAASLQIRAMPYTAYMHAPPPIHIMFLGTGTSNGVPVLGCTCAVCASADPCDARLRTSALVTCGETTVLIDVGPDFRQQALRAGLRRVDAVLLTHAHADHIAGLDDLRPLNYASGTSTRIFGDAETLAIVRERFAYAFAETTAQSSRPALDLHETLWFTPFTIGTLQIEPLAVHHGTWQISAYHITLAAGGPTLGYVTDASHIPPATAARLAGVDMLVLNALRPDPHPTHFSLSEALVQVAVLAPGRARLVHMNHSIGHASTNAALPPGVALAHDGLVETIGVV